MGKARVWYAEQFLYEIISLERHPVELADPKQPAVTFPQGEWNYVTK